VGAICGKRNLFRTPGFPYLLRQFMVLFYIVELVYVEKC
jgi:hypothetical protein